ncbi:MAG: DNA polymerase III subunit gamma/tau, partial [Cyanobacteria bacterium P01_H01_bin.121]
MASNQASPLDAKTASPSDSAQPLDSAQPVSFMAAWDQDQTSRAARSLSQFFNGEVVSDLDTDFEMSEFATAEP